MSTPVYSIRRAVAADADTIARHRVAMFRDMGSLDERDAEMLTTSSRAYFVDALPSGHYIGWVIETGGAVVGGAGVLVSRGLPRPDTLDALDEAYLLNVYVDEAHRRRGLARRLTETVLAWCRERGMGRVVLHASDDGRRLYESLGFVASPREMRLVLPRR